LEPIQGTGVLIRRSSVAILWKDHLMTRILAAAALAASALAMAGCGHTIEQKAATGAIAGAVVGGPVGAAAGAAVGTAVGQAQKPN